MRNWFFRIWVVLLLFTISCKKDKKETSLPKDGIAFIMKDAAGSAQLWYMATDGSSQTRVRDENITEFDSNPTWSSDRRSIFFIKRTGISGENGVYSVKANGSDFKKVYTDNSSQNRNYYQLAASNNDEHVIFSLDIPRSGRKVVELYRMCPCGDRVERLTSFETSQTPLINTESYAGSFAPGDTTLYFTQSDPTIIGRKDVRLYRININSKQITLIQTIKANSALASTPSVSPNGQQLLLSIDGTVHVMNTNGTGLKPVGSVKGYHPVWDPNGADFYFSSSNITGMEPGLYKCNITLTTIQKLSKNVSAQYGGLSVN